ncbi:DUF3144 domain-containing protein [Asticcacaulis sp. EMRT-3]|uniref:DUF3144 domain-containing protein n=1 Tax=Asticcacaulis sp. EMRT-3 TaxID=3040349 RepID=UPI0024AF0D53|nr:DUF3144 domain-containing protein [Asticcacaulis sp. EMRT-3]MDI7776182.1 DUF3144 domain-containing protein [Asticcacaulis sp. EMRT-3]
MEFSDRPFFERANAFIEQANQFAAKAPADRVSLSLIHAAARFHVWLWAASSQTAAELKSRKENARELYLRECQQMFDKQFDEYASNFDRYIAAPREAEQKANQPG